MFLIEYDKGFFVDGHAIEIIKIKKGVVEFKLKGSDDFILVRDEYYDGFANHLQAINNNITNLNDSINGAK